MKKIIKTLNRIQKSFGGVVTLTEGEESWTDPEDNFEVSETYDQKELFITSLSTDCELFFKHNKEGIDQLIRTLDFVIHEVL